MIPVRLALFAEMMKGKAWTPARLRDVGGAEGVGCAFLEETFSAATAPPEHRLHQKAARAVLKALLPASGSDIKGHMLSHNQLLEASGYQTRPKEFEELLHILDSELRLITPTELDTLGENGSTSEVPNQKYYQLTHDYLVGSLHDWLNRKKRESRVGRTELLLDDLSSIWNARPNNRNLPSLFQWLQILRYTSRRRRTPSQNRMVGTANRYFLTRLVLYSSIVALLVFAGFELYKKEKAGSLHQSILSADPANVTEMVARQDSLRPWLNPLLQETLVQTNEENERLNASLALLPFDKEQAHYLCTRMLTADDPKLVVLLIDRLSPYKSDLQDKLWDLAQRPDSDMKQPLRAAAALAAFDAPSPKWSRIAKPIVNELVRNPVHLSSWIDAYRPVRHKLLKPIQDVLREPLRQAVKDEKDLLALERRNDLRAAEQSARRNLAATLLLEFAKDDPVTLTEGLLDSDENEFPRFLEALAGNPVGFDRFLLQQIQLGLGANLAPDEKERRANQMANAGVYLMLLKNTDSVWNLLKFSDDLRARSYLTSRIGRFGVSPDLIIEKLEHETDVTIRRALIQALGGYPADKLLETRRNDLVPKIQAIFRDSPDAGSHSSAEWLLRTWKLEKDIQDQIKLWKNDNAAHAKATSLAETFAKNPERSTPTWYVSKEGFTMVAIPGRVDFTMGSPVGEDGRLQSEAQRTKRIPRSFAISSKLTTNAQYSLFDKGKHVENLPPHFKENEKPVVRATWFEAAAFCNWLSEKEGLETCYTMKNGKVVGVEPNYLDRTGYRLPTEAEVEYANRAMTKTARFYGETEDLLGEYAWYQKNSGERTQPVGTRKPNDFGLFDVQGNTFTWCHNRVNSSVRERADDTSDEEPSINLSEKRALRGGAFYFMAISLRAARSHDDVPTMQGLYYGFRVARTLK